jgi:hypothetical protein
VWNLFLDLLLDRQTAWAFILWLFALAGAYNVQPAGRTVIERLLLAMVLASPVGLASVPAFRRAPGKEPFQRTDAAAAGAAVADNESKAA